MIDPKEEITLRDIIEKIKISYKYLKSKWYWLFLAGIVAGGIAVAYVWLSKPKYTASLSFILSSNTQPSGGILGLANQFGIDLSSGNSDVFTGDNIITLMSSRSMVQKALLQKPPGNNETLLNILVKEFQMDEGWNNMERTKNAYPFPDDTAKMTYVQDSLFREVYDMVTKNFLSVSRPDKDQSVYIVSTTSTNEIFSLYLTKFLVQATSKFYIDTKTSVARKNLEMIQHEADSLQALLSGSIASTARVYDYTYNLNPSLQAARSGAQEGQLQITALGTAFGEVLKNVELAKINLQKETPLYQIIDEPQLPLVAEKSSRLIALIVGGLIGVLLMICFLLGKKVFKKIWY